MGLQVQGDSFIKSDMGFKTSTDEQTDRLTELIYKIEYNSFRFICLMEI